MPISEYIPLALLATRGIALTDGNCTTALGAEAIAQPNGGASSVAQVGNRRGPKKDGGTKLTAARTTKGHSNHKRRANKNGSTTRKTTSD
jgi:hypothetical protein